MKVILSDKMKHVQYFYSLYLNLLNSEACLPLNLFTFKHFLIICAVLGTPLEP